MASDYNEQLALLKSLQEIDLNLYKHQRIIEEFPERIREAKDAFDVIKSQMDSIKSELAEIEDQKATDEKQLAESVEHLREREARLYAIKTNKEYQAAIKELSEGKRINREREDRILRCMERTEELNQKSTQLQADYADKEAVFKRAQDELKAEEDEVRRIMQDDEERRPDILSKLDKKIVRKYDFIRKRYVEALSKVEGGACHGCSTRIPPQLLNEMLRCEEWKSCPSCQRLIFTEKPSSEEDGSEG